MSDTFELRNADRRRRSIDQRRVKGDLGVANSAASVSFKAD
jgi:hypothetical protein